MSLISPIVAAGDLFALFIYLAIALIWVVLKKVQKMGQRSSSQEESPPDSAQPLRRPKLDPTLQEFLENLTGQKLDEQPPPAPQAVPPPVTRIPTPVPSMHVLPQPVPEEDNRPGMLEPMKHERPDFHGEDAQDPAETIVAPHVESTVLGAASSLAGIQTPKIAMPSFNLPNQRLDTDHRLTVSIGTPKGLRRAMIERIVLGKPLAMGTDYEELQIGW